MGDEPIDYDRRLYYIILRIRKTKPLIEPCRIDVYISCPTMTTR